MSFKHVRLLVWYGGVSFIFAFVISQAATGLEDNCNQNESSNSTSQRCVHQCVGWNGWSRGRNGDKNIRLVTNDGAFVANTFRAGRFRRRDPIIAFWCCVIPPSIAAVRCRSLSWGQCIVTQDKVILRWIKASFSTSRIALETWEQTGSSNFLQRKKLCW